MVHSSVGQRAQTEIDVQSTGQVNCASSMSFLSKLLATMEKPPQRGEQCNIITSIHLVWRCDFLECSATEHMHVLATGGPASWGSKMMIDELLRANTHVHKHTRYPHCHATAHD